VLSQVAHVEAGVPWIAILLVHAVFFFDACFTLTKRASRGESFWRPHREHNYQLLIRSGWSHTRTTLLLWLLSLESCTAGLIYTWSNRDEIRWMAIVVTAVTLSLFAVLAHRALGISNSKGQGGKDAASLVAMEQSVDS